MFKFLSQLPSRLAIMLISVYQLTFSPDHGLLRGRYPYGFCRHYPTCSEYTKQAISKNGLLLGGWMGIKRVSRCNPWTEPSVDNISL